MKRLFCLLVFVVLLIQHVNVKTSYSDLTEVSLEFKPFLMASELNPKQIDSVIHELQAKVVHFLPKLSAKQNRFKQVLMDK